MSEIYDNIKAITSSVFSGNAFEIAENISDDEFKKIYLRRLYTSFTTLPRLCRYINLYMNDFNAINIGEIKDFIHTLNILVKKYNIKKQDLFFGSIKKEDESVSELKSNYSPREVRYILELMKNGIIVHHREDKIEDRVQNENFTSTIDIRNSESINELCKEIIERSRVRCERCPMFGKSEKVVLETNLEKPGPVDIILVGINPGKEEALFNRPFIGKSGRLMRTYLDKIISKHKNLTYLITNIMLCSTDNESKIPQIKKVISICKNNFEDIIRHFKPFKYMILFGDVVVSTLLPDINGKITSLNSRVIDNKIISVHPSMVVRNPNHKKYLEDVFNKLDQILSLESKPQIIVDSNVKDGWILFDIKRIGNNVVMIFTDENGRKRYIMDEIKVKSFIKSGSYRDCDIITETVDREIELKYDDYVDIVKKLKFNMRDFVEKCGL